jgi:uncharacterized membrane protein
MGLEILSICLLMSAGVQLGTLWIMKTSILPLLNALPYDRYVNTCQLIDMHVFHPIALWNGIVATGLGATLVFLAPTQVAAALFGLGSAFMLLVGATSEGVNRPIWRQIERWSPRRIAAGWAAKRRTWHLAHQVRTFAAVGALLAFAGAAASVVA